MSYPTSDLSQENILRDIHDPASQTIRVSAQALVPPGLEIEISAADGDNIAISDGTDTLAVNADGSINVVSTENTNTSSIYNEVSSVASFTPTTILSTVAGGDSLLKRVDVSGDNIATYELLINASIKDKRRSYFGNSLNCQFEFAEGLFINSGDVILVRVTHERPSVGTFNARIQLLGV